MTTDSKGNQVLVCDNGTGVSGAGPRAGRGRVGPRPAGSSWCHLSVRARPRRSRGAGEFVLPFLPPLAPVREVRLCRLQLPLAHLPVAGGQTHHPLLRQNRQHRDQGRSAAALSCVRAQGCVLERLCEGPGLCAREVV